jgi:hypothetical protein
MGLWHFAEVFILMGLREGMFASVVYAGLTDMQLELNCTIPKNGVDSK